MVIKNQSCLFGFFFPHKGFLSIKCSVNPLGSKDKQVFETFQRARMSWIVSDISGEPCCSLKPSWCGAPANAAQSRWSSPGCALGSLHKMKSFLTLALHVLWGSMLMGLHRRGKGGTWDANRSAASRVSDVHSLPLLALVYNKGRYAKVDFNKDWKWLVSLWWLQRIDGPTSEWPWFLCLWLQSFFKPGKAGHAKELWTGRLATSHQWSCHC